jgi:hypothetical protein
MVKTVARVIQSSRASFSLLKGGKPRGPGMAILQGV